VPNSNVPDVFHVDVAGHQAVTATHYHAATPRLGASLVFAHGAGAGQHSPFIVGFARATAAFGIDLITFDFPYMEQRRRVPDRPPVLEACYAALVEQVRARTESARAFLFIGGKSMGGRIATQLAASTPDLPVAGLVVLGYPLHPPGQPQKRRDAHLPLVRRPMLVVQGSRDSFGGADELRPVLQALSPPATLHIVEGGDHSFKVARAGAEGQAAIHDQVRRTVADWIAAVTRAARST
jgi:predicted alpha/beta-hydrolase family hydrolase